ncbi:MAG: hypothetical protein KAI15_10970, partial [Gammaproteobacteria bacterium]|nr:hypothetical protein [Gammaproteobacteria bacterium]
NPTDGIHDNSQFHNLLFIRVTVSALGKSVCKESLAVTYIHKWFWYNNILTIIELAEYVVKEDTDCNPEKSASIVASRACKGHAAAKLSRA